MAQADGGSNASACLSNLVGVLTSLAHCDAAVSWYSKTLALKSKKAALMSKNAALKATLAALQQEHEKALQGKFCCQHTSIPDAQGSSIGAAGSSLLSNQARTEVTVLWKHNAVLVGQLLEAQLRSLGSGRCKPSSGKAGLSDDLLVCAQSSLQAVQRLCYSLLPADAGSMSGTDNSTRAWMAPLHLAAVSTRPGSPQQQQLLYLMASLLKLLSGPALSSLPGGATDACISCGHAAHLVARMLQASQAEGPAACRKPSAAVAMLPWLVLLGRCCLHMSAVAEGLTCNTADASATAGSRATDATGSSATNAGSSAAGVGGSGTAGSSSQAGQAAPAAPQGAAPIPGAEQKVQLPPARLLPACTRSACAAALKVALEAADLWLQHTISNANLPEPFTFFSAQLAFVQTIVGDLQSHMQQAVAALEAAAAAAAAAPGGSTAEALAVGMQNDQPLAAVASSSAAAVAAAAPPQPVDFDLGGLLKTAGLALCSLPVPGLCNNPICSNMSGLSELHLVNGKNCMCAGCRVGHYCCRACQKQHLGQHKPACWALRPHRLKH